MKVLLDSCALVDLAIDAATLTADVKAVFEDEENAIYVSVASIWELGLKKSLGKLDFDIEGVVDLFSEMGIEVIDINLPIVLLLNRLPYHHKDPFDRVLIATAKVGGMKIATSDDIFSRYGVDVIPSR